MIETLNRHRDVPLREALRDPELKQKLVNLLGSLNGVLSIDMVSAENQEVMASTLENRIGSKAYEPDFRTLLRQRRLVREVERAVVQRPALLHAAGPGRLQQFQHASFYVRVVIYPALIRPSLKDTLYQKAEVAISRWRARSC